MKNGNIIDLKAEIEKVMDTTREKHEEALNALEKLKKENINADDFYRLVDKKYINFNYDKKIINGTHTDIVKAIEDGYIYHKTKYEILGNAMLYSKLIFRKKKIKGIENLSYLLFLATEELVNKYNLEYNCCVIQALLNDDINNETAITLLKENCNLPF